MRIRSATATPASLAMALLLSACGSSTDAPVAPSEPVASVALSTLPAQMLAGEVAQLTATVMNTKHTPINDRPVVWNSSNEDVATVSSTGQVSAVGHGAVTITASVDDKSAAVTTVSVLTQKARRFAYTVVANDAPLIGAANPSVTENATGGAVTIEHPSAGDYTVTFGRMARADTSWRETVMLSMLAGGATHCHVNDWWAAPNGHDLEVSVSCYATDNRKMGGAFSLLVIGGGSLEGRHSFVYNADSSESNTPSAAAIYNSSGQAMAVHRVSSGSYRVDVNNPREAAAETYFITTFGNPAATCVLSSWSYGSYGTANCVGPAAAADARFAMQLIEGGRAGKMFGFAWASSPTQTLGVEYVPSNTYQRMSNGERVAITHTTTNGVTSGVYDVRFPGFGALALTAHSVQVSAYASGRVSCSVADQGAVSGGADLTVRILCYDRYSGAPTNAYFTVLVIE